MGDGPDIAEAKELARQLGVEQKVRFLGERSDVESVLRNADIGVLASNWEGLPISIIEYMRAGLPVVASSVGGVPELVEDGVNGFLVARGDVDMLAQKIEVLANSGPLRGKLGSAGRTLFETKFSDRRMVEQIIRLYEEILPAAPPASA